MRVADHGDREDARARKGEKQALAPAPALSPGWILRNLQLHQISQRNALVMLRNRAGLVILIKPEEARLRLC